VSFDPMDYVMALAAFLVAFAISLGATPLVKVLAERMGAMDVPRDSRRMHKFPIPRLGGLAIFFGFIASVLLFCPINPHLQSILLGAVLIILIGVMDDIKPMSAKTKLLGQIAAAMIPILNGVRVEFFTNFNPFSNIPYINLGLLSVPITLVWIVGITNAVNLIDGLDGLAVGISSIASFSLFIIAVLMCEPYVALLLAALAGACVGFMPYNFNPAKIFMGDTGALFLGYILATISLEGMFKFYTIVSFAVPFLILGLPIFDTTFAIVRRLAEGRSPMSPDRGHLHHRLMDMGFTQKQTVAILYAMSAILGLSAVLLTKSGVMRAAILLFCVIVCIFIAYEVFERENRKAARRAAQEQDAGAPCAAEENDDGTDEDIKIWPDPASEGKSPPDAKGAQAPAQRQGASHRRRRRRQTRRDGEL